MEFNLLEKPRRGASGFEMQSCLGRVYMENVLDKILYMIKSQESLKLSASAMRREMDSRRKKVGMAGVVHSGGRAC